MVATVEVITTATVIPSASEGPHQLTFRRDLASMGIQPVQLEHAIRGRICAGTLTFLEVRMYTVYLLSSRSRVLYVGVTDELSRRLAEHRSASALTFCGRYRVTRLVHLEVFSEITDAIAREKQVKGWRRSKKVALICVENPRWLDLAAQAPDAPGSAGRDISRAANVGG